MGKQKKRRQEQEQDAWAQGAAAIGGLVIITGALAAVKEKTGLSWTATVMLVAGVLVLLGYLAWKIRTGVKRLMAGDVQPAAALRQEAAPASLDAPEPDAEAVPAHPELTAALVKARAIGKDETVRADDVTITPVQNGRLYDFLVPEGRTYADVEKKLGNVAGTFGVTRLHTKIERSRDNERRVKLLLLNEPPFTRPFPPPTWQEIEAFNGVPLGHDVTGQLVGVSFERASLLIGGMTQMGKTTLVNGLITCLLIAYGEFDLYLLDGKFCGLTKFEKIAIRYEASDNPAVLESMLDELNDRADSRYVELQEAERKRQPQPTFRPVFFIVDEAADFYTHNGTNESKELVARVADKSRALVSKSLESGITTVMLTQRPSQNAIPVMVRDQFQYRMCLYVASEGTAKVALGDTYFDTVAPINPALLDPNIKGQAVLFAQGVSTLIRGFRFADSFIWDVVDKVYDRQQKAIEQAPVSPLKKAIDLMRSQGVEFMPTSELAPAVGITETRPVPRGKELSKLLSVTPGKDDKGVRGYWLSDLIAAAKSSP
ncbi:FtsK/SpoIIIE domain-containing protein [Streptomyces sp. CB03238]|uniref:FtsK/SpoIIIE domain-containing protein n=1 Tax=Streptomyces sp. CB03238 TaxID=1907777 RepID=UPI000A10E10D|nr:FtsK/SpoIIIE domain-containing protein [Streptomyces sp. CB03238]ORT53477.1 hypothetical protein BKD26_38240 [Streptomyces sp. CB03238]